MKRHRLVIHAFAAVAGLALGTSAWAQNPHDGEAISATRAYQACMADPVDDYAQRAGSPERLAAKIALLCRDELAAVEKAYVAEFFSNFTATEAADMAGIFVSQIAGNTQEVARLDIVRLRIEAEHNQ